MSKNKNKNKKKVFRDVKAVCPKCGFLIERTVQAVKAHYQKYHQTVLLDNEAFRLAARLRGKQSIYGKGLSRSRRQVSGGGYGMGSSRKH